MRRVIRIVSAGLLALAVVIAGCTATSVALPDGEDAQVAAVVDGDTIRLADERRVRLIGVDTPETKHPAKPAQCMGKEASWFTAGLLAVGTAVRLVADVEHKDRYGRTLAYVYRASDGLFVNAKLVRDGYARPYTVPPNVEHAEEFVELAAQARNAGLGLWGACR